MTERRISVDQKSNLTAPSGADWKDLVHQALIGNGVFPQANLGQAILVANGITEKARAAGLSFDAFCFPNNPPIELVESAFDKTKQDLHKAYGFTTPRETHTEPTSYHSSLWTNAQTDAMGFINQAARLVYTAHYGLIYFYDDRDRVKDHPAFMSILESARTQFNSRPIRELSRAYKAPIARFMHDYAPTPDTQLPPEKEETYKQAVRELQQTRTQILYDAVAGIHTGIVTTMIRQFPNDFRLMEKLAQTTTTTFFGKPSIPLIDPHAKRKK